MENKALSKTFGPPADLHKRELPITNSEGQRFRISQAVRGKDGVIYFGKNKSERFDDPKAEFGVCYLGIDAYAAFIEVFGQSRQILLNLSYIYARSLSILKPSRTLKLVDITAQGAAWIGAAGEVAAGDHALSQIWARELYLHPQKPDGILYRCRHDGSKCSVALFDGEPNLLTIVQYNNWAEPGLQTLLGELLDNYRFAVK